MNELERIHSELNDLIARTTNAAGVRRAVTPRSHPNLDIERYDGECEAILYGCDGHRKKSGDPCGRPAGKRDNGRVLCWTHNQARMNPVRSRPLQYVRRGENLESLLERSVRLAGGEP